MDIYSDGPIISIEAFDGSNICLAVIITYDLVEVSADRKMKDERRVRQESSMRKSTSSILAEMERYI